MPDVSHDEGRAIIDEGRGGSSIDRLRAHQAELVALFCHQKRIVAGVGSDETPGALLAGSDKDDIVGEVNMRRCVELESEALEVVLSTIGVDAF